MIIRSRTGTVRATKGWGQLRSVCTLKIMAYKMQLQGGDKNWLELFTPDQHPQSTLLWQDFIPLELLVNSDGTPNSGCPDYSIAVKAVSCEIGSIRFVRPKNHEVAITATQWNSKEVKNVDDREEHELVFAQCEWDLPSGVELCYTETLYLPPHGIPSDNGDTVVVMRLSPDAPITRISAREEPDAFHFPNKKYWIEGNFYIVSADNAQNLIIEVNP